MVEQYSFSFFVILCWVYLWFIFFLCIHKLYHVWIFSCVRKKKNTIKVSLQCYDKECKEEKPKKRKIKWTTVDITLTMILTRSLKEVHLCFTFSYFLFLLPNNKGWFQFVCFIFTSFLFFTFPTALFSNK